MCKSKVDKHRPSFFSFCSMMAMLMNAFMRFDKNLLYLLAWILCGTDRMERMNERTDGRTEKECKLEMVHISLFFFSDPLFGYFAIQIGNPTK